MNANCPPIVVSGLPRSGTSMMMQMLKAGGLPITTDFERSPDASNPRGYFEHEAVKQLPINPAKVPLIPGMAIKIVAPLVTYLPDGANYRVLFMVRNTRAILESQNRMLAARQRPILNENPAALLDSLLHGALSWLSKKQTISTLFVHYEKVLAEPLKQCRRIEIFLGIVLNVEAMCRHVEPLLCRSEETMRQ